jgi:hypothetical protein
MQLARCDTDRTPWCIVNCIGDQILQYAPQQAGIGVRDEIVGDGVDQPRA